MSDPIVKAAEPAPPPGMSKAKITLIVFCWAAVFTSLLLFLVTHLWPIAPGVAVPPPPEAERNGISLIMVIGAIGGFVRWIHYMRVVVFDRDAIWQWLLDSALTPLMGAALALVFSLALRAGVTVQTSQAGATVNWVGLYALAGIVGLFSPDAMTRLQATFRSLFATESSGTDTKPRDRTNQLTNGDSQTPPIPPHGGS